jgi:MFS family permease
MGDAGTSWLYAARGFGSVAGPLLVQSYFPPHSPRDYARILIIALVLGVIGYTVWAISPLPLIGMLGILSAHLGGGCNWTYRRMVVQRESPDHLRGRILSLDTVGFSFAAGVFSFLIGLVARNSMPMYGALSGVVVSAVLGVIWIAYLMRTIMRDDKLSTQATG